MRNKKGSILAQLSDEEDVESPASDHFSDADAEEIPLERPAEESDTAFGDAVAKLLVKKVKSADTSTPILAVSKKRKELDVAQQKEREEKRQRRQLREEKRQLRDKDRLVPTFEQDRELERTLKQIATRGVVKLFNAVSKARKLVDTEKSRFSTSNLVDENAKNQFLEMLKSGGRQESDTTKNAGESTWKVLNEDLLLGRGRMKDYGKETEIEEEEESDIEIPDEDGDSSSSEEEKEIET
mmetsp:Transcript_37172/g.60188  ORF Transcript_37172/g.60188 Transcript_37172/m.60188 type:complete len:240 (-) Transcript_37172:17-736(-)